MDTEPARLLLETLAKSSTLSSFVQLSFNPTAFAADIIKFDASDPTRSRSRAETVVSEIAIQLTRVEDAIQKHVIQHREALMQSMDDLGQLKSNCSMLTSRSSELRKSITKLHHELLDPYQSSQPKVLQLQRVHEVSDLLKQVAQFTGSLGRLRTLGVKEAAMAKRMDARNIAKAALEVRILEGLVKDEGLQSLSLVAQETKWLKEVGMVLRQAGKDILRASVEEMDQAELGAALQIFYNLQSLPAVVADCIASIVNEAAEATKRTLEAAKLDRLTEDMSSEKGAAAGSRIGSESLGMTSGKVGEGSELDIEALARRQGRVRSRDHADKWATSLYTCSVRVWNLQRVLQKKADATGSDEFLEVVMRSEEIRTKLNSAKRADAAGQVGPLYWFFWTEQTDAIQKIAEEAVCRANTASLVRCYPNFFLALSKMLDRLCEKTTHHKTGSGHQPNTLSLQSDPTAFRALMDALDADVEADEVDPRVVNQTAYACGTPGERNSLLETLAELRDMYLAATLQRLSRPIEQMFPRFEGYTAAIPSKHDLQAFFKIVQHELSEGLEEGGPLVLVQLERCVGSAVKLLCTKIENLLNTSEAARKLNPLRGWILTPEKEHNLQLFHLLTFLHTALRRLPKEVSTSRSAGRSSSERVSASGETRVEEACKALEELAIVGFLRPELLDIATELAGIMAEVHLENYAPDGQQEQKQPPPEESSRAMRSLQVAVAAIRTHHLSRLPQAAEFVARGLQWLTGRLVRSFISHAALLRPLNDKGKAKLSRDLAILEDSLSAISKVSELGAPYQELRAFRELCFYSSDSMPLCVEALLKESFMSHLRPSTLLNHLFSRCPIDLTSPHVVQRCSERTLVDQLLALYYDDSAAESTADPTGSASVPTLAGLDSRVRAEQAHVKIVHISLDAYMQRTHASGREMGYMADIMQHTSAAVMDGFEKKLRIPDLGGNLDRKLPLNW